MMPLSPLEMLKTPAMGIPGKIAALTFVYACLAVLAVVACDGGNDAPATAAGVEWGYDGLGAPENWASLSEEYAICGTGEQQSPIDITGYEERAARPVSFLYGGEATAVRNDGKFMHVDYAPGNTFSVGQRTFELKSTHLHSPSEHRIDGESFASEMHLVHADADGRLAVVALLFRLGEPSPAVQAILDAAPAVGSTTTSGFTINASDYVPRELGRYHYEGSKTTPPCYEPVTWFVMRDTRTISTEQADSLMALNGGPNNRPVQPTGSRVIVVADGP